MDKNLIALTHVCRDWREVLIAHSSLWARLDCTNAKKTHVYIERSKSSPLVIALYKSRDSFYLKDVLPLVIPHISRVTSISIIGNENTLQGSTKCVSCPVPLLRKLAIDLTCKSPPVLSGTLFNGDLSSLCTLSLGGVIPHLPWKNLSRLTTFVLHHVMPNKISVTRLLDFFMNAPFLRDIELYSIPDSSDAPPGRVVSLPCIETLTVFADRTHSSAFLSHLSLPSGALLHLEFDFSGDEFPLLDFLPGTTENLQNISCITSVYFDVNSAEISVGLDGSTGSLFMCGYRVDWPKAIMVGSDRRVLRSLDYFPPSGTQRLAITNYESPGPEEIDVSSHILDGMKDLRTLRLIQCNNLPFILALNPNRNFLKLTLCPELEELILYINEGSFNIGELTSMAKERASQGAKLSSITIVGLGFMPGEVLGLGEHVARVEYRVKDEPPQWDSAFGDEKD
ncbi:hypothetical protein BDM02DRAFT_3273098 [Thelephora ganbajun]|uniref:Uncharacterized protein n=1 Tax=Thelephora ganbajun TaxID=370292 RepID=A0ACB6Z0V1_THEGA|nr:hypothetical protein BDM02DRAFT_3273098 [Thelephora ganbajun]